MDEVKRKGSKMASREQKFSTQCPCGPLHSTMWNTQCTKSSTNTSVKHKVHKIINKHLCETHSAKKIINNGEKNEFPSQLMTNPPPLEIQLGKETKESWLRKTSVRWKVPTYQPTQRHTTHLSEKADGGLDIGLKLRRALPLNPWHLQILLQSREKSTFAGAGASRWQLDFVRSAAKKWRGGRRKLSPG